MKKLTRTRSFWVYPSRKDKYFKFRCFITPSGRRLRQMGKAAGIMDSEKTGAFCQSWRKITYKKKGKGIPCGDMGNIVLAADDLFSEYIAHECSHAAHAYCRRIRKGNFRVAAGRNVSQNEETFCYAQGYMTQQIHNWIFKQGLGVLCFGKN